MSTNKRKKTIIEQAAQNVLPKTSDLRQAAENNPHFKEVQQAVANQPLVPPKQMKHFLRGMAVLNNPRALNGLMKKTNIYDNPEDRKEITTFLSNGAQLWTKGLANASAALTIKQGDEAKRRLKAGVNDGKLTEQQVPAADEAIKQINAAQKSAMTYLMQNKITNSDMQQASPEVPQKDGRVTEDNIRDIVRERIESILKKNK